MNYQNEQQELSIDTVEGLQEFLRFIEDVYRDFIVALQQRSGAGVMVSGELMVVETAYRTACERINQYSKLLIYGGELLPSHIEELQAHYDSIVKAYDALTQEEAALDAEMIEPPVSVITKGVDITHDRVRMLATRAADLVFQYSELDEVALTSGRLGQAKTWYTKLKHVADELRQLSLSTHLVKQHVSPEQQLYEAEQIASELDYYEQSIDTLDASLRPYFVPPKDTVSAVPPEEPNSAKQPVRKDTFFDQTTIFTAIVKKMLTVPEYKDILRQRYSSPAAFEAALKREVYRVEKPSKLDRLLGVKYRSAFEFLKDMTVKEVRAFDEQTDRMEIRRQLQAKNIPYETYLAWVQAMPYMESLVRVSDITTYLELFVRAEIALLILDETEKKNNSQGVYN